MRIQRQSETYSWRVIVAGELPPGPKDTIPMPKGFPGTGLDWLERVNALEDMLDNFRRAGIDSRSWHSTVDPITGERRYSPEREAMHEQVMNHFRKKMEAVPRNRRGILMAGLGGAGKTSLLNQPWSRINMDDYFSLSADENKDKMADLGMIPSMKWLAQQHPELVPRKRDGSLYDFTPMELSSLIQAESKDLTNRQAQEAYDRGTNVVWDYRMGDVGSAYKHLEHLGRHGYKDTGAILVDVSPATSRKRGIHRHHTGQSAYYQRHSPLSDPAKRKEVLRGGRRLPMYATTENNPRNPASGALSSAAEAFQELTTQRPDLLPMGWLHIDNEDFNNPIIRSATGLWNGLQIPSSQPQPAPQPAPQPVRPRELVTARRMFVSERDPVQVDPESVLGMLDAYRDGQIDFDTLVSGIAERYAQIHGIDRHPERADWSEYLRSEFMPDDDDGWWIGAAVWSGVLTPDEADTIRQEVHNRVNL